MRGFHTCLHLIFAHPRASVRRAHSHISKPSTLATSNRTTGNLLSHLVPEHCATASRAFYRHQIHHGKTKNYTFTHWTAIIPGTKHSFQHLKIDHLATNHPANPQPHRGTKQKRMQQEQSNLRLALQKKASRPLPGPHPTLSSPPPTSRRWHLHTLTHYRHLDAVKTALGRGKVGANLASGTELEALVLLDGGWEYNGVD